MQNGCERFRNLIPKSLLGDVSTREQEEVNLHLTECVPCSHEKDLYVETLSSLRASGDESVPRHFFVYPQESRPNPWRIFRQMAFGWQASLAVLLLLLGILSGISLANLRVQNVQGTMVFAFGRVPAQSANIPVAPSLDLEEIETRILQVVEERNRKDKLDWVRNMREEIAKSQRSFTQKQRTLLETALAEMETRLGNNLAATALALQNRNDSTITRVYQAIAQQHDRDMNTINSRLTRFAIADEAKSTQTDSILETLLQVAELRIK
jgi:hypothetical protein